MDPAVNRCEPPTVCSQTQETSAEADSVPRSTSSSPQLFPVSEETAADPSCYRESGRGIPPACACTRRPSLPSRGQSSETSAAIRVSYCWPFKEGPRAVDSTFGR